MSACGRFNFSPFAAEDEQIIRINQLSDSVNAEVSLMAAACRTELFTCGMWANVGIKDEVKLNFLSFLSLSGF